MSREQIFVSTNSQPLEYINREGETEELGQIQTRVFEGEELVKHVLVTPATDSKSEKEYNLGIGRNENIDFINHAESMGVMVDNGFTIKDISLGRGGSELFVTWEQPDSPEFDDPINWDRQSWGGGDRQTMTSAVVQRGSIKPGKTMAFGRGFFRLVCTNGLVRWTEESTIGKFTAKNWDPKTLADGLFGQPAEVVEEDMLGHYVGTVKGMGRVRRLLADFVSATKTTEQYDEWVADKPQYILNLLGPIRRLPGWYMEQIDFQMGILTSGLKKRDVHQLDIENMATNAINLPRFGPLSDGEERETHAVIRPLRNVPALVSNISDLAGIYSLVN